MACSPERATVLTLLASRSLWTDKEEKKEQQEEGEGVLGLDSLACLTR